jgi:hypothetical protein
MKMPGLFFLQKTFLLNKYRIEYDAYRYDYELLLSRNNQSEERLSPTDEHIQRQYQHFKQSYEKSKADVIVKLKLLDENRVCIFH